MLFLDRETIGLIRRKTNELADLYPMEANYSSRCSLWSCGLQAGNVTEELFDAAHQYYGRLWNYVGD
jgi:hypothetical protein